VLAFVGVRALRWDRLSSGVAGLQPIGGPVQLNHLNLCVNDLDEARRFFEANLGFQTLAQRGEALAILNDGQGFTLTLTDVRRFGGTTPVVYPQGFHVGFLRETKTEVDAAYARLLAAGIATAPTPRMVHGGYGFYFMALGAIQFEIACLNP
jgi:catechol 2,3-dioxygenase-like lactoylglutathione lyase family enzyme